MILRMKVFKALALLPSMWLSNGYAEQPNVCEVHYEQMPMGGSITTRWEMTFSQTDELMDGKEIVIQRPFICGTGYYAALQSRVRWFARRHGRRVLSGGHPLFLQTNQEFVQSDSMAINLLKEQTLNYKQYADVAQTLLPCFRVMRMRTHVDKQGRPVSLELWPRKRHAHTGKVCRSSFITQQFIKITYKNCP